MIPVLIGFTALVALLGSAAVLMPLIRDSQGRSRRRRRRSKGRKRTHAPRERLQIFDPADDERETGA